MKQHGRHNNFFCWLASSQLPPLVRTAVVLLALVQIVAPSWHVCALGGSSCHDPHQEHAQVWKPKCGGGPKCSCVKPEGALYSPTGQWISAPVDDAFHGTCLARLLLGMPNSTVAPFHFTALFSQRTQFVPYSSTCPIVAALPQPPSRGPPLFCV